MVAKKTLILLFLATAFLVATWHTNRVQAAGPIILDTFGSSNPTPAGTTVSVTLTPTRPNDIATVFVTNDCNPSGGGCPGSVTNTVTDNQSTTYATVPGTSGFHIVGDEIYAGIYSGKLSKQLTTVITATSSCSCDLGLTVELFANAQTVNSNGCAVSTGSRTGNDGTTYWQTEDCQINSGPNEYLVGGGINPGGSGSVNKCTLTLLSPGTTRFTSTCPNRLGFVSGDQLTVQNGLQVFSINSTCTNGGFPCAVQNAVFLADIKPIIGSSTGGGSGCGTFPGGVCNPNPNFAFQTSTVCPLGNTTFSIGCYMVPSQLTSVLAADLFTGFVSAVLIATLTRESFRRNRARRDRRASLI